MKNVGKTEFLIKKKSPEIFLALGVISFVATIVTVSKAALEADDIVEERMKNIKTIRDNKKFADEHPEEAEYDDDLYKHDVMSQRIRCFGELGLAYGPSIGLAIFSIGCFITSRNIMQKRYLGVMAAYNGLYEVFKDVRKRVIEEAGVEKWRHYRYGSRLSSVPTGETEKDAITGKKFKKTEVHEDIDSSVIKPKDDTCRFFDSSNRNWDENPAFSMMWLNGVQNNMNDILHTRGHVFLNEVYDALGFPQTPQGQVLGWVEGMGDDYIDFGLYDPNKEVVRRFVNGLDNVILLEFNHDGPVWDKI